MANRRRAQTSGGPRGSRGARRRLRIGRWILATLVLGGIWRAWGPLPGRVRVRLPSAIPLSAPATPHARPLGHTVPGPVDPTEAETPPTVAAPPEPSAPAPPRDLVHDFPYRDDEWLLGTQKRGGRLWVPADTPPGTELPIVVLLHGLNSSGKLHRMLSPAGHDLGQVARGLLDAGRVRPVILAAPSQTRGADTFGGLWPRFSLDHFLWRVRQALPEGVTLDARRVVILGHNGAGCSRDGGLLHLAHTHGSRLRMLAAVDTCPDPALGRHLRDSLRREVTLLSLWQPRRPTGGFERALGIAQPATETEGIALDNARTDGGKWWSIELGARPGGPRWDIVQRATSLVLQLAFPFRAPRPAENPTSHR